MAKPNRIHVRTKRTSDAPFKCGQSKSARFKGMKSVAPQQADKGTCAKCLRASRI